MPYNELQMESITFFTAFLSLHGKSTPCVGNKSVRKGLVCLDLRWPCSTFGRKGSNSHRRTENPAFCTILGLSDWPVCKDGWFLGFRTCCHLWLLHMHLMWTHRLNKWGPNLLYTSNSSTCAIIFIRHGSSNKSNVGIEWDDIHKALNCKDHPPFRKNKVIGT